MSVALLGASFGCVSGNRPSTAPDAGDAGEAPATAPVVAAPPPAALGPTLSARPLKARPQANQRTPLGTNLAEFAEGDRAWVFLNLMQMGRTFISKSWKQWDDGRDLHLSPEGYPERLEDDQEAVSLLPSGPGGPYVLLYDGRGEVRVGALEAAHRVVKEAPGRQELQLVRDAPFSLTIAKTDPADPVRNIRVVPLAHEKDYAEFDFHPQFLERVGQFRILRFMDWTATNGSKLKRWADRSRPFYVTQSQPNGVAYEWLLRLANTVHADAWICVPHLADDDFVERLATLVKAQLAPGLKLYLEFSNEVWNDHPDFTQAQYARAEGARLRLSGDANQARLYWQARRTRQVFEIFERVFGAEKQRLVRVVASQVGSAWAHEQLLGFEDLCAHTDALAVAPYFGVESASMEAKDLVLGNDPSWLLDHLEQKSIAETTQAIEQSAQVAKKHHLPLIAYEGGQHLVSHPAFHDNAALQARYDAANRDPRMKTLYLQLLAAWKKAGGHEFVHFTFARGYDKYNRFGMFERVDATRAEAPKYDALLTFAESNPAWW